MKSSTRQRGITLIGFVVVLAIIGFFAFVAMRLFPLYAEYYTVVSAMEKVANRPGVAQLTPDRVRYEFLKQFEVDPAYYFEDYVKKYPGAVKVSKQNGYTLQVQYERGTPFMYNLEIVAKFSKTMDLVRGGGDDLSQ